MYLHSILQKSSTELVRKVFDAQKANTSPGDFYELVSEDKDLIGLNLSDIEIGNMKKEKLRNIVKAKIRQSAFKYLKAIKTGHSKMDKLTYTQFEMAQYLKSPLFNSDSMKLLLALRTRTVEGIKNDFRGMFADIACPLQCGETDTIEHILGCTVLRQNHTSDTISHSDIKYEDIFSSEIMKQKQATELFKELLEVRNNLLNSPPVATTGPVHCV